MAWTTPRTWVPDELVTDTMLNTHVRDNLNAVSRIYHQLVSYGGVPNEDAGPTPVYQHTIPAGFLSADGDTLDVSIAGYLATAATKQANVYLQSVLLATLSTTAAGTFFRISTTIRRTGATTQIAGSLVTAGAVVMNVQSVSSAMTWAAAAVLELYIQGAATGDIYLNSVIVEIKRAP